jgi:hypothetical protein
MRPVTWRRRGVTRRYVGALEDRDGALHLSGRDPETGIEVSLGIPYREIESVRLCGEPRDGVSGGPCLVLGLAGSLPICLQEVGVRRPRLVQLAGRLEERIIPSQTAGAGGRVGKGRRRCGR